MVIVFFDGTRLICANVGDSRAIKSAIFKEPGSEEWKLRQLPLNVDHKPELELEADRILSAGGRIQAFRDPENTDQWIGPERVWL